MQQFEYEILKKMGLSDEQIKEAEWMCELMCGEVEDE